MKIKVPSRPNFSRSAKLCDQNLYFDNKPLNQTPSNHYQLKPFQQQHSIEKPINQNYFFKSVSREKRGNFRFKNPQNKGQFIYYPQHSVTKSKSPSWVFSKDQKYQNQKFQEIQVCYKHPFMKQTQDINIKATQSMKDIFKDRVKIAKNKSFMSTACNNSSIFNKSIINQTITKSSLSMGNSLPLQNYNLIKNKSQIDIPSSLNNSNNIALKRNYSIIDKRSKSPSGFFNKSKIQSPKYLKKQQLNLAQSSFDQKRYLIHLKNNQKGYVQFHKKKGRDPNFNRKGFQYFVPNYQHEKQFSNFSLTNYPIKPESHINFDKHLDRPSFHIQRMGPNPQVVKIDFTRKSNSNINYKTALFRDKIRTRYDRAQPQPNTRLDIDIPLYKLPGMVSMDKVIKRNQDLFPIIDPIIKKAGDNQMKQVLKKHIFKVQVNEAHNYVNPDIMIKIELNKKQ